MADIAPGTLVDGRYKVLSRLGSGGMADVFLAEDQQLGRKVALKLLHRRFAEDPGFVERFRREAQAAAVLQHPNVVGVYDRGAYDDTYYIAMEYLSGRSLKQLIRQEAPLDPIRAIELTIRVLARPGTPTRRTWPLVKMAARICSITSRWPMTTLASSATIRSREWRNSSRS